MLQVVVTFNPPGRRSWFFTHGASLLVELYGDIAAFEELQAKLEATRTGVEWCQISARRNNEPCSLFIFCSSQRFGPAELHVIGVDAGVIITGDGAALQEIVCGVEWCLKNARSDSPITGYHHHIMLYGPYAAPSVGNDASQLGELILYDAEKHAALQRHLE